MKKRILTMVSILAVLIHGSVYADDNRLFAESETIDEIVIGKITLDEDDDSDTIVEVTLTSSTGEASVIYTGTLEDYGDEMLTNIDFSETDVVMIFEWNNGNMICIRPSEELVSENLSTSQKDSASMLNTSENSLSVSDNLSISSQIKINGVNVGEDGLRIIDNASMSCTFSVENNSNIEKSVTALLVTYNNNGEMQNVRTAAMDVAAENSENMQIIYQFDAENEYTGKLMMWDSLSGMIPLRATIDFTQTSGVNAYYYNQDNRLLQVDKKNGTSLVYTYDNMGNLLTKTVRE